MNNETNNPGFSDDEADALAAVLDEIIPPTSDGQLPGAGALGLVGYIAQALEKAPELRPMILQGLAEVDDLARRRHATRFSGLSRREKVAVLNEQGFLLPLMIQTYTGYYQNVRVVEALGLEGRPPHPKGYQMEPNDWTLLDGVRRRPKQYRDC